MHKTQAHLRRGLNQHLAPYSRLAFFDSPSPDIRSILPKPLIRPQSLQIFIPQTHRHRNLAVPRPRHQIHQTLDGIESRSPHRLGRAQSEVEIKSVTVQLRPRTQHDVR